jgi:hypothetical protein
VSRDADSLSWPRHWQKDAIDALRPYLDADVRVEIVLGDPRTSIDGTVMAGYVYTATDGRLEMLYDHTGPPNIYPWPLLVGPVLRIELLPARRRRRLIFAHPDWTPRAR